MMKEVKVGDREYQKIHNWISKEYGKADNCENPECKGHSKHYEWALLKGREYDYKRENFIRLCKSCHFLYDQDLERVRELGHKNKGAKRIFTEEHIRHLKGPKKNRDNYKKPKSEEHKRKISEAAKKRWKINPIIFTDEHKRKISEAAIKRNKEKNL